MLYCAFKMRGIHINQYPPPPTKNCCPPPFLKSTVGFGLDKSYILERLLYFHSAVVPFQNAFFLSCDASGAFAAALTKIVDENWNICCSNERISYFLNVLTEIIVEIHCCRDCIWNVPCVYNACILWRKYVDQNFSSSPIAFRQNKSTSFLILYSVICFLLCVCFFISGIGKPNKYFGKLTTIEIKFTEIHAIRNCSVG